MALLFNRVKVTTATTGTGTLTLGAAFSAFFATFAEAGVPNGAVVSYVIENGTNFEIGVGTYTSAGTTLSRDTVRLSKIAGVAGTTKLTLVGSSVVYIDAATEDLFVITNDGYARLPSSSLGIQFNGDTAAANALDDYEEGTWTPVITGAGGNPTITYTTQTGSYTKIGNLIFARASITINTYSGGSGRARFSLPFAVGSGKGCVGAVSTSGPARSAAANTSITMFTSSGNAYGEILEGGDNVSTLFLQCGGLAAGDAIFYTCIYEAT